MKIGCIRIDTDTTMPTVFAAVAERQREGIAIAKEQGTYRRQAQHD